jgi:hypothetical protein
MRRSGQIRRQPGRWAACVSPNDGVCLTQLTYCIAGSCWLGSEPTAFQGTAPLCRVVVLGGTSLIGGRGFPVSGNAAFL